MVDVRHADTARLVADCVLRLLLRADEEHGAAALGDRAREVVRLLEQPLGLLQVDDVDAAALGEDEALHLRVPATGLVAEVDAGLQQFLHGNDGHESPFLGFDCGSPAGLTWKPASNARPPSTKGRPTGSKGRATGES